MGEAAPVTQAPSSPGRAARDAPGRLRRDERGRHTSHRPDRWSQALASWPWVTIVLLVTLVIGGVELLRSSDYAATAGLTATDGAAADLAESKLADPALPGLVEEEVELGSQWTGRVGLDVGREPAGRELRVTGTAPDPRLAALAADTAAALVAADVNGTAGTDDSTAAPLQLTEPATVPSDPARSRTLSWAWIGLLALVPALWLEGAHRVWLRGRADRAGPPPGAAR